MGLSRLRVLCFYLTITADVYQQKITVTILLIDSKWIGLL
jgi:hypothetical protein